MTKIKHPTALSRRREPITLPAAFAYPFPPRSSGKDLKNQAGRSGKSVELSTDIKRKENEP